MCAQNTVSEVRLTALFFSFALLAKPVTSAFPPDLSPELSSVVQRYVSATEKQRQAMLGVQMEMDIDGRFTKLREQGRMRVLRTISKLGELGIRVLEFTGDNRIKTELIARYLDEEQKAKAYGAMTIAPADYDFEIKAILKRGGQMTYVFDVSPRRNDSGRFRGELWVDGATGMPLKESGQMVKSPSLFLANLRFTRDYELRDGIAFVKHFKSSTDVRLLGVGRAELDVTFGNVSQAPAEQATRDETL
jgi:hypothetical protein